ncbi:MAG: helix-turn-helix domain-containing protein [Caldilineaceae bacterium]|nr:helix-turn-helix domain-containing protein [Caldilineaceae bacterium]
MTQTLRIGLHILPADPFWVQVREAAIQRAQQLDITIVPLTFEAQAISGSAIADLWDELQAHELNAFVGQFLPRSLARYLLQQGLPLIFAEESDLVHPLSTAPLGLSTAAKMVMEYMMARCAPGARLAVFGNETNLPTASTRTQGYQAALRPRPDLNVAMLNTPWRFEEVCDTVRRALASATPPFDSATPLDGIFGYSDPIALAAAHVGRELGFVDDHTYVVGINGDPLALAAIVDGSMHATVETGASDLARNLIDYACRAAQGETLPASFPYRLCLVTRENVAQISAEKLIAIAELPSRLVDVNRRQEEQRVRLLETSLAMHRQALVSLDGAVGLCELVRLICERYEFDDGALYIWDESLRTLGPLGAQSADGDGDRNGRAASDVLNHALLQNRPVYIPDTEHSQRFAPDSLHPATRARVALPVRHGHSTLAVLDLHNNKRRPRGQAEIDALQTLADQLGGAIRNARLFSDAVAAKRTAEQANQHKTRLLTNVSHELRTPLDVIMRYSAAALVEPSGYATRLPPKLRRDQARIQESGRHLSRLINDLLDLSQAESGSLTIYPERLETLSFLSEFFDDMQAVFAPGEGVQWQLHLSEKLPPIMADPVRLRQILVNLISNAAKFTQQGRIALGANAVPGEVHIWVEDTGRGIPADLLNHIFEAFVTAETTVSPLDRSQEGIGLGLSLTRELVHLHGGRLKIDSLLGYGTTCHLYWPLPVEQRPESPIRSLHPTDQPLAALLDELTRTSGPLVRATTDYIHAHFDHNISRAQLADAVGFSPNHVARTFREEVGLTPWQYLNRYRVAKAQHLLRTSETSVTDIATAVGFNSPAYFCRIFRRESGKSPHAFRIETGST